MDTAFHLMAKPTGARCNLHCAYCFFLKKSALYPGSDFRMSDAVMESYIRQTLDANRTPVVELAWQGGEPTLMGLDFFRRAVAFARKCARPGVSVRHAFQTNGVLLDEEWCEFLRDNGFLVGLSLDGPRDLHDAYRRDRAGQPVFDRVVRAARLMQAHRVEFNVLCTVNSANSRRPLDVYRFFRDELKTPFLQLIPIVERVDEAGDAVTERSVRPADYGRFLIAIFDEWARRDVGAMFVTFFDSVLSAYVEGVASLCVLQPACGRALALEHNGDLYSCDHFVDPAHRLGNILQTPLADLVRSERQQRFGKDKGATLPRVCRQCRFQFTCYGECPKNRLIVTRDGERLNYLCEGLKAFFAHVDKPMQAMAQLLRQGRPASEIMRSAATNRARKSG